MFTSIRNSYDAHAALAESLPDELEPRARVVHRSANNGRNIALQVELHTVWLLIATLKPFPEQD